MRKLWFHKDKRTGDKTVKRIAKRTAAGAAVAVIMALQIAGCSQAGSGQEKTTEAVQTSAGDALLKETTGTTEAGAAGEQADAKAGVAGGDGGTALTPGMPIKEGVTAPDFTADLTDGTSITLSDLQGKPVIINFWAAWCGPCVREMPAFERLQEDFGDEIGIIAVNCGDDADTVKDFVSENGYTFPIALDEEYEISMLYPTSSIPYTVVVDGEGTVTHVSAGAADADTMYERYKEALGV